MYIKFFIRVIPLLLLCVSGQKLFSQQVVLASGAEASGSGGSSSYSVGQIDYSTKGTNGEISEGVQQPYEIFELSTTEMEDEVKNISLYPNPVKNVLYVDFNNEEFSDSNYLLFDLQGKLIQKGNFTQKKNELNLSFLPSSVYVIQIFRENKIIKTFKIIKK